MKNTLVIGAVGLVAESLAIEPPETVSGSLGLARFAIKFKGGKVVDFHALLSDEQEAKLRKAEGGTPEDFLEQIGELFTARSAWAARALHSLRKCLHSVAVRANGYRCQNGDVPLGCCRYDGKQTPCISENTCHQDFAGQWNPGSC
jgi:hypothetical protein